MTRAGDVLAAIRALPVMPVDRLGSLLVVAPHPDDESLGCGGSMSLLCDAGRPPAVLFVTDGAASHPGSMLPPGGLRELREREALAATVELGVPMRRVRFLRLPDGAAPTAGVGFEQAVAAIVRTAAEFGCTTVAAPWWRDPHCDHEAAHLMARACGLRLLSYPVWGWLLPTHDELAGEPEPAGLRVSVAAVLDRKRRAIAAHASQMGGLDDPNGFVVPPALLEACTTPFEYFIEGAP